MIKFDLERALAGDKIITRNGSPVSQLVRFKTYSGAILYGLDCDNDIVESWICDGRYHDTDKPCGADLFMAPKKLRGFVNLYSGGGSSRHTSKVEADTWSDNNRKYLTRTACIDLSQHEQGEGI